MTREKEDEIKAKNKEKKPHDRLGEIMKDVYERGDDETKMSMEKSWYQACKTKYYSTPGAQDDKAIYGNFKFA